MGRRARPVRRRAAARDRLRPAPAGPPLIDPAALGKADRKALTILRQPPFAPEDARLFTPQTYGAPASEPAAPPKKPVTEASLEKLLRKTLSKRFRGDRQRVAGDLALFRDPELAQIVPDPRLRAALVLLDGTAGESAIAAVRGGVYRTVQFGQLAMERGIAQVRPVAGDPAGWEIVFNERYEHEDPRLHAQIMAHEAFHQDDRDPPNEELIAAAMDTLVHAQFVAEVPRIAAAPTELTRRLNTALTARLNSRDDQGSLRVLTSQGNVWPGSALPLANYGEIRPPGDGTPGDSVGNAHLDAALSRITGQVVSGATFSDATLTLLDENQNLLSATQLLKIAGHVDDPAIDILEPSLRRLVEFEVFLDPVPPGFVGGGCLRHGVYSVYRSPRPYGDCRFLSGQCLRCLRETRSLKRPGRWTRRRPR